MDNYRAAIPNFYSVIPAKAGIQMVESKFAIRNQA